MKALKQNAMKIIEFPKTILGIVGQLVIIFVTSKIFNILLVFPVIDRDRLQIS